MKLSGIPTSSIFDRLNILTKGFNSDIIKLQTESITGQSSDYGLKLGSRVTGILEIEQEKSHIAAMLNDNALVKKRLSASQINLGSMGDIVEDLLQKIMFIQDNSEEIIIDQVYNEVQVSFKSFMSFANMKDEGRYLFSGINISKKPLNDYFSKDSLAKKSFDQMLKKFLEDNSKLSGQKLEVSSMTSQHMNDFLKQLEDKFSDDEYWLKNWSNSSNQNINYRLQDVENIDVSVNVNTKGIRDFMLFSVIGTEFLNKNMTESARKVVNQKMISTIGKGLLDINHQRASLGISEKRIDKENVFLQGKSNIIEVLFSKSVGIDGYKVSTQLSELMSKIDMSYMITSKLQKLSLLNYL
ncbi:flagellar hook-associated family protein [Candidatus Liberibacter brunswickensis]|uniref:flagellar hook-associated family protein n=1 Tax=Candidatus Liberibacter brunswickensis TaxID=1968796 RepID=UPI002FE420C4